MALFRLEPHDPAVTDLSHDDSRHVMRLMQHKLLAEFDHPGHREATRAFVHWLGLPCIALTDWVNLWSFYGYFGEAPEPAVCAVMLRYGREWTLAEYPDCFGSEELAQRQPRVHFIHQLMALHSYHRTAVDFVTNVARCSPNMPPDTFHLLLECLNERELLALTDQIAAQPRWLALIHPYFAFQRALNECIRATLDDTPGMQVRAQQDMVLEYAGFLLPAALPRKRAQSNEGERKEVQKTRSPPGGMMIGQ
jgi:hypothetical protein